jgi:protein-S-isoprenylcysteine O-methyltransferase Ste14
MTIRADDRSDLSVARDGDGDTDDAVPPVDDRGGTARPNALAVHLLTVFSAILLLVTTVNVWVQRAALDTDNWVDTTDELLADDDVRNAISVFVVDELYAAVDVADALGERLPGDLAGLAGPVAAALRGPAVDAVDRLLATDRVATAWRTANRAAHATAVRILNDETRGPTSTTDGVVSLDLRAVVVELAATLGLSGAVVERIPDDAGQVTIVESSQLASLQTAVAVLEWASVLLFVVVLGLFVLAIGLARGWRRIALRNVGLSIFVVGLLGLAGLRVGGRQLLDSFVESESNRPTAQAVWRIGSSLLRDISANTAIIGLVIVAAAAIAGPNRVAVGARGAIAPVVMGSAALRWGVAAALFLLLVLWAPMPLLETWLGVLIVGGAIAMGVEALRRLCQHEADTMATAGTE